MSILKVLRCDFCPAEFSGTRRAARKLGWVSAGGNEPPDDKPKDRCPACRRKLQEKRKLIRHAKELKAALPPRRVATYGAAAYMKPERAAIAMRGMVGPQVQASLE